MATWFLDTSALVKLYVREEGTPTMLELVARPGSRIAVAAISRVEIRSALRRRQRTGEFAASVVDAILERVERDFAEVVLVQPIDHGVVGRAAELIDRHGLRAYDAIQLAACGAVADALPGEPVVFACADRELVAAAAAEQYETIDPSRPAP